MNIYKELNKLTEYIDEHLTDEIDYKNLSKILGVNTYTMQRLFSVITGIGLSEYIRKRRLSMAGFDLYNEKIKIIDVALKYHYDNPTSFSRAFLNFHGIKPSEVKKDTKLKNFPRITFNEFIKVTSELEYEIIELDELNLYGVSTKTNNTDIKLDAPLFFRKTEEKYKSICGNIKYGMITYNTERELCEKYYCLYNKKLEEFEHIKIPKSKWLKFRINSQSAKDIQEISDKFYKEFLPSCKFNLKELPELEHYHDNITDFLVAID